MPSSNVSSPRPLKTHILKEHAYMTTMLNCTLQSIFFDNLSVFIHHPSCNLFSSSYANLDLFMFLCLYACYITHMNIYDRESLYNVIKFLEKCKYLSVIMKYKWKFVIDHKLNLSLTFYICCSNYALKFVLRHHCWIGLLFWRKIICYWRNDTSKW